MFGYSLHLPDLSGSDDTRTEIRYDNLGDYRLYGVYDFTMALRYSEAELLRSVIADLKNLPFTDGRDGHAV